VLANSLLKDRQDAGVILIGLLINTADKDVDVVDGSNPDTQLTSDDQGSTSVANLGSKGINIFI
jgi:hypothetical protein